MRRLLALFPLLLGACAPVGPLPGVADPAGPDAGAMFPECQNAELAFAGETTLAALGLHEFGGGPEASKVGLIWVTAGPVSIDMAPVPDGKGAVPAQRLVCVQWPDGSGMMGPVDDAWQAPSILDGGDGGAPAGDGPPLGVVALAIGAVVLVGASMLAFRRDPA